MTALGPSDADIAAVFGVLPDTSPAGMYRFHSRCWLQFGDRASLRWCARALVEGHGVERAPADGVACLADLAGMGDTAAAVDLGGLHRDGKIDGLPDPVAALAWFRFAAERGDIDGMIALVELAGASPDSDLRAEAFGWALRLMGESPAAAEMMRRRLASAIEDMTTDEIEAAAGHGRRVLH